MKTFPEAVQDARRLQSWTREEIADRLGVSPHTVEAWLKPAATSRREAPSWATHALTALAYGKAVSERRGAFRVTYEPATRAGSAGPRK